MTALRQRTIVAVFGFACGLNAAPIDDVMRSFENQAYYVRPLATLLGSMTNTGWYHSASVGKGFGYYAGLPISLTYIAPADRYADTTIIDDGCVECHKVNGADRGCIENQKLSIPTMFGSEKAPSATASQIDINGNVVYQEKVMFSDGFEAMSKLPLLPFATLQADFSLYYTELKLRYFFVPAGPVKVSFPGFGLQHDLASILPALPVSLSVAGNMTFYSVSWAPGGDIDGDLTMSGLSIFAGALAGYQLPFVEFFLEAGWEYSRLNTGGTLSISPSGASQPETINPDLSLVGSNMMRISLNAAFPIVYLPVIGGGAGANFTNTVNILGFGNRPE